MESIISKLYYGEISPCGNLASNTERFRDNRHSPRVPTRHNDNAWCNDNRITNYRLHISTVCSRFCLYTYQSGLLRGQQAFPLCCATWFLHIFELILSYHSEPYHNTVFLWKQCFFVVWRPPEQAWGFWLQRNKPVCTGLIHIVLLMKISICYFDAAGICSKSFMNKGKTNVT